MDRRQQFGIAGGVLAAAAGVALFFLYSPRGVSESTARGGHLGHGGEEPEVVQGPHGGRLLGDEGFAVEVTIFERGVPPEYRVYCYDGETPIDPGRVRLTIELARFGGRVDTFRFSPREDHLVGDGTVEEPHSFDVTVVAEEGGRTHRWEYASYEGRTELSPEGIRASGVVIETIGPASVATSIRANGRVVPNEDRLAHVIPRYPGIVKEVRKRLGDPVERNEVLAIVESNESLQPYEVRSSIGGTVIRKDVTAGKFAREGEIIYTVADLSTVWADLNLYPEDFHRLRLGQAVDLETSHGIVRAEGKIIYLSPVGSEHTQTLLARVELHNPDGHWRPGLFVTGEIVVEEATVPIAVRTGALQTFRDWDVVFLNEGKVFQAMPVELGRRGDEFAEVLEGVEAGQRYVAGGSFIIKADIGKSGAVHEH
jgi:cobalt-zinc-cadmium efflux system membrane fusion protein